MVRAEKERRKASPSRGFAGMRTVGGGVCDRGTDAAGNVDGAALRIVEGSLARWLAAAAA